MILKRCEAMFNCIYFYQIVNEICDVITVDFLTYTLLAHRLQSCYIWKTAK